MTNARLKKIHWSPKKNVEKHFGISLLQDKCQKKNHHHNTKSNHFRAWLVQMSHDVQDLLQTTLFI